MYSIKYSNYFNRKDGINMTWNKIIRTLKSSLLLRFFFSPYIYLKKIVQYRCYKNSKEAKKIKGLKNIYYNKRCFIIGNGPSLSVSDLEKIKHEITIGSNRIYEIFNNTNWRPTIYISEDPDSIKEVLSNLIKLGIYGIQTYVFPFSARKLSYIKKLENNSQIYFGFWNNNKYVINRYNDTTSHISEEISDHFSIGYTVTFSAIQLAIYMGIKEIYLIGVDFNYSRVADKNGKIKIIDGISTYFDGKERTGSYLNYYSCLNAFNKAKEYCLLNNIKIYNATRGGKLEVFERVCFDDIV